jgi:hypothetical protein
MTVAACKPRRARSPASTQPRSRSVEGISPARDGKEKSRAESAAPLLAFDRTSPVWSARRMKGKTRRAFARGRRRRASYFAAIAFNAEARTAEQQAGHTPIGKNASGLIPATVGASCDVCYASTDLLSFPAAGSPINWRKRKRVCYSVSASEPSRLQRSCASRWRLAPSRPRTSWSATRCPLASEPTSVFGALAVRFRHVRCRSPSRAGARSLYRDKRES